MPNITRTLKDAFLEFPTSIELYKICSSYDYDAMTGDIKYHNSCRPNVIDKRTPEIQVPSKSHHLEVQETYESNIVLMYLILVSNSYSMRRKLNFETV